MARTTDHILASLNLIPAMLHAVGLYCLVKVRRKEYSKSSCQYVFLVNLSLLEFLYSIKLFLRVVDNRIISHALTVTDSFFFTWYVLILIFLTLDRFLEVYLNIRYNLYCSTSKAKFILAFLFLTAFTMSATVAIVTKTNVKTVNTINICLYLSVEGVFILLAVVIYGYILFKISKLRRASATRRSSDPSKIFQKNTEQCQQHQCQKTIQQKSHPCQQQQQQQQKQQQQHPQQTLHDPRPKDQQQQQQQRKQSFLVTTWHQTVRKILLPLLLVATFLIFWIIPDVVSSSYEITNIPMPVELLYVVKSSYILALVSDAFIYTLSSRHIKKLLSRKLRAMVAV